MKKYFVENYDDEKGEWVKREITKEEAIAEISKYYNNAEECVEMACYYRTMFGGVEVVEA